MAFCSQPLPTTAQKRHGFLNGAQRTILRITDSNFRGETIVIQASCCTYFSWQHPWRRWLNTIFFVRYQTTRFSGRLSETFEQRQFSANIWSQVRASARAEDGFPAGQGAWLMDCHALARRAALCNIGSDLADRNNFSSRCLRNCGGRMSYLKCFQPTPACSF